MSTEVANKPTFIDTNGQRFLIMDRPTDQNLPSYLQVMKKKNVVALARACEPSYAVDSLNAEGITVLDVPFEDGDPPPEDVVTQWLALVQKTFANKGSNDAIAVHCVAGLGRAPVLVAIALVENGMQPTEAIALIRKKRRGAFNAKQLKFLDSYKRRGGQGACCVVM